MVLHGGVHRLRAHHRVHDGEAFISFVAARVSHSYLQVAAFFLAFKGVDNAVHNLAEGAPLTASDLFSNPIFRNIVISLLATLGLYILASLIFVRRLNRLANRYLTGVSQFEPWHMITSFIQYLLMAPSYIAVLNVYAVSLT